MNPPLRVLLVEDSEDDAALLARELQHGGLQAAWTRVENAAELEAALDEGDWDLVIADYTLPSFSGPAALAIVKRRGIDVPFLVVSGTVDEDTAISLMRAGAEDCIAKGNLRRLVATIERELREADVRRKRRRAEEALRDGEARTRAIVNTAVDGIITIDERGTIETFNPAAERLFGIAAQEAIGQNVRVLMPSPYRQQHDQFLASYLETGERKIIGIGREVVGLRMDGTTFPMDLAVSEVRVGDRRVFTGIVHDISARKAAEEAIRRQRDFAESLIETAPVIVLVLDRDGRIVRFNPCMEEISGYRLPDVQDRDWFTTFLPARDCAAARRRFADVVEDVPVRGDVSPIVSKDGVEREIEWYARALKDAAGTTLGVLSIGQDITERKRAERRLTAQYAVTRVLAESTSLRDAIPELLKSICVGVGWELGELWRVDSEANLLRWDGMWAGVEDTAVFTAISREATFAPGNGLPGQVWSSGQPKWVHDFAAEPNYRRAALAAQSGLHGACAFPVRTQRAVTGVMQFLSRESRAPDHQLLELLDALGRQIGDFIERKRTESELHELQRRAQQRERLADIGAITAQIVHDVGNPLAGVSMQAQLILRRAARDDSQPLHTIVKPAERIYAEASRLDALIKEFMDFSREQLLKSKPIDMVRFLEQVVGLWQPVAAAREISLSLDIPIEPPPIFADEEKLRRVFENLVKNAIEAIDLGPGRITLRVLIPGDEKIRIDVEDTGPGIAEGVQAFRLFETTKPQGTGLGLAIAKQIILAHGGHIGFEARAPRGTAFYVVLPFRSHGA